MTSTWTRRLSGIVGRVEPGPQEFIGELGLILVAVPMANWITTKVNIVDKLKVSTDRRMNDPERDELVCVRVERGWNRIVPALRNGEGTTRWL